MGTYIYDAHRDQGGPGEGLDEDAAGGVHDSDQTCSPPRARSLCAHIKI